MTLGNQQLLVIQFAVAMTAWSGIAAAFLAPRLARTTPRRALRAVIAPQMFRIVGTTLLANNVPAPGLDSDFVRWVAIGDAITAGLAVVTFFMLARPGRLALVLASLTTLVGAGDMFHNLANGVRTNAAESLGAGWFVVTMIVPAMFVAHLLAGRLLLRRPTWD